MVRRVVLRSLPALPWSEGMQTGQICSGGCPISGGHGNQQGWSHVGKERATFVHTPSYSAPPRASATAPRQNYTFEVRRLPRQPDPTFHEQNLSSSGPSMSRSIQPAKMRDDPGQERYRLIPTATYRQSAQLVQILGPSSGRQKIARSLGLLHSLFWASSSLFRPLFLPGRKMPVH